MSHKNYLSVYAKSFNWAGFFLPKKTYNKCSALYDFCRVADNIADDNEKLEVKEIKFKQFEEDFTQKNFDNSIIKNDNFQFDLSSIAKGFAVDSIAQILIEANKNNFLSLLNKTKISISKKMTK